LPGRGVRTTFRKDSREEKQFKAYLERGGKGGNRQGVGNIFGISWGELVEEVRLPGQNQLLIASKHRGISIFESRGKRKGAPSPLWGLEVKDRA